MDRLPLFLVSPATFFAKQLHADVPQNALWGGWSVGLRAISGVAARARMEHPRYKWL